MSPPLRTLLLLLVLALSREAMAIRVEGIVRDAFTRWPMAKALVVVSDSTGHTHQRITRIDGYYRFELRNGRRYVIRFSAEGCVTRHVILDARTVPSRQVDHITAELDMRLFPPLEGMDPAWVGEPMGESAWSTEAENVVWDTLRSGPQIARWNALLEAHLVAHPEQRPSRMEVWLAKAFDLVREWGLFISLTLALLLHGVVVRVLRVTGKGAGRAVLAGVLVVGVWLVLDLRHETGPLRAVALIGLLMAVWAAFQLVFREWTRGSDDLVVVEADDDADAHDEPDHVDEEEPGAAEGSPVVSPETMEGGRRARIMYWVRMAIFFAALMTFMSEGRNGLENTRGAWAFTLTWATIGLMAALTLAWLRTLSDKWRNHRSFLSAGGMWWVVLPLVAVTVASYMNRSFPQGHERCTTWNVEDVSWSRRSINVYVSWAGERRRLEMPRAVKEQLTTVDSLRCCVRKGLLGHDHVFRIDPVITADPR